MSNKTYDVLKWIAQYLLPASATLYFALSNIWGLPYGEEIVGTIVACNAFLGVLLGISTAQYNKVADGLLSVDSINNIYKIELEDGAAPTTKKIINLRVNRNVDLSHEKPSL